MISNVKFNLHRKLFGDKQIDQGILDYIYDGYVKYNNKLKLEQVFNEETFKSFISIMYSVLSLNIKDSEFTFIIDRYIKLILIDQLDQNNIDINWIIDHLWYLVAVTEKSNISSIKYRKSLDIIKDNLIERFDVTLNKK